MATPNSGNPQNQTKPTSSFKHQSHQKKNSQNPKLQTRRSTTILSPRATTTHHDPHRFKTQPTQPIQDPSIHHDPHRFKTHNPRPISDLREPRPTTHVGLDAPMNRDGAMIHGEDEKLSVGNDGEREMGWERRERLGVRVLVMEREGDEKRWRENTCYLHIKY